MYERGVSLIEILLVVAIIVIFSAISLPVQNSVLNGHNLSDGTNNIQIALRSANLQSRLGEDNLPAGVYFGKKENGDTEAVLYKGQNYLERNPELDVFVDISADLEISVEPESDINFHILSGEVLHDTIIVIKNSAGTRTLKVNLLGTVFEIEPEQQEE